MPASERQTVKRLFERIKQRHKIRTITVTASMSPSKLLMRTFGSVLCRSSSNHIWLRADVFAGGRRWGCVCLRREKKVNRRENLFFALRYQMLVPCSREVFTVSGMKKARKHQCSRLLKNVAICSSRSRGNKSHEKWLRKHGGWERGLGAMRCHRNNLWLMRSEVN